MILEPNPSRGPTGGTVACHGPGQLRSLGSVGNPFDRVWPPTTSGDLQPIFSHIDSQALPPIRLTECCMYVGMQWVVGGQ